MSILDQLFGGGGDISQRVKMGPWGAQAPYLQFLFQQAQDLYNDPNSRIAGFNPWETKGQDYLLNLANNWGQFMDPLMSTYGFLSNKDILNPETNPYLAQAVEGATRPLTTQLLEQALPNIKQNAFLTGGVGGSRQSLAEAQAIERTGRTMGDISSAMYNQNYQTGLNTLMQALQLAPMMQQLQAMPANIYGQVGGARRQMEQARLDEPTRRLMEYQGFVGGNYGQEGKTTQQGPRGNPWLGALGAGLAGTALWNAWGPQATGIGAGGPGIGAGQQPWSFLNQGGSIMPWLMMGGL